MRKKKRSTLAEQLLAAIEDCPLTLTDLAARCEMNQPTLTRFVAGTRRLTLDRADNLVEFFEMRLTKPTQPKS